MQPKTGINSAHLAVVAHSLSQLLADEFVLYTKTKKAHWNVEGPDFYSKHLFFEQQYTQLDDIIDTLAERIRILGHYAPGTLKEYLELTHLSETAPENNGSLSYIKGLLADHESILIYLRENINHYATTLKDQGTGDYVTGLVEAHEKMAWMLRAHLK
jgi:starvation-inducible DNA-binding protein